MSGSDTSWRLSQRHVPRDVRSSRARGSLVTPPVRHHLGVARVLSRAEGDVLDAVRPRLHVAHRVLVEPDRIPLAELDDLAVDLDPGGAADDDVDLLLALVLVS